MAALGKLHIFARKPNATDERKESDIRKRSLRSRCGKAWADLLGTFREKKKRGNKRRKKKNILIRFMCRIKAMQ